MGQKYVIINLNYLSARSGFVCQFLTNACIVNTCFSLPGLFSGSVPELYIIANVTRVIFIRISNFIDLVLINQYQFQGEVKLTFYGFLFTSVKIGKNKREFTVYIFQNLILNEQRYTFCLFMKFGYFYIIVQQCFSRHLMLFWEQNRASRQAPLLSHFRML